MRKMMVFEDCRSQKSGAIRDITGGDTVAGLTWTTSGINDGDRIFASELFLAYERILYMTAFEILQNQEDAEDAVMTAAGNIWKDLDKIKDLDTEVQKARILMTARNAARDIYRKNRKREACREGMYLYLEQQGGKEGWVEDAQEILFRPDVFGRLQKYVLRLKEEYQHILVMKYHEEMSNKEIAERLHLPESTVATRIFRARQILRRALEKEKEKRGET